MAHTAHKNDKQMEEIECSPQELQAHARHVADLIAKARKVVFFTGAGISTSAGVPDFRGPQGAWTLAANGQERTDRVTPMSSAVPTYTHRAMVALHGAGRLHHVISQNVDGMHRKSGIPAGAISELHGNSNAEECNRCGKRYYRDFNVHGTLGNHFTGRKCSAAHCGGDLRDTIINFGENLPAMELNMGFAQSEAADLHVCLGSSLTVSPACDMPRATKQGGGKVVIVNLQRTPLDDIADVRVHGRTDAFMAAVMEALGIAVQPFELKRRVTLWHQADGSLAVSGVDVTDGNSPQSLFERGNLIGGCCMTEQCIDEYPSADFVAGEPMHVPAAALSHADAVAGRAAMMGLEAVLHFYGHHREPELKLPVPAASQGPVSYDITWDLSMGAWNQVTRLPEATMPNYEQSSGPRRTDKFASAAAPPPPSKKATGGIDTTGFFAVHALPHCPHCPTVALRDGVVIDVQLPCIECGNVGENMLCLGCFEVHCGRHVKQHMLAHHERTGHPMVAGFADLSFWCYECDSYVAGTNKHLNTVRVLLERSKFPEDAA